MKILGRCEVDLSRWSTVEISKVDRRVVVEGKIDLGERAGEAGYLYPLLPRLVTPPMRAAELDRILKLDSNQAMTTIISATLLPCMSDGT